MATLWGTVIRSFHWLQSSTTLPSAFNTRIWCRCVFSDSGFGVSLGSGRRLSGTPSAPRINDPGRARCSSALAMIMRFGVSTATEVTTWFQWSTPGLNQFSTTWYGPVSSIPPRCVAFCARTGPLATAQVARTAPMTSLATLRFFINVFPRVNSHRPNIHVSARRLNHPCLRPCRHPPNHSQANANRIRNHHPKDGSQYHRQHRIQSLIEDQLRRYGGLRGRQRTGRQFVRHLVGSGEKTHAHIAGDHFFPGGGRGPESKPGQRRAGDPPVT